ETDSKTPKTSPKPRSPDETRTQTSQILSATLVIGIFLPERRPERLVVARKPQTCQLVQHDVIHQLPRGLHEPPVEADDPSGRPARPAPRRAAHDGARPRPSA